MAFRCIVMGAAGRDFHDFATFFRDRPEFEVVAFTAAQIPFIERRVFPRELAGPRYDRDIPILTEAELPRLVRELGVDFVFLAYSDLAHEEVMHKASIVQAAGAGFALLGPRQTQLSSLRPVVAVTAVRTGAGKSPVGRAIARHLSGRGVRVAVMRHPMPYGDLRRQAVQRFAGEEDLDREGCTIEEREEYAPHLAAGQVVFVGVDTRAVRAAAEREPDVILWDGGNNDYPFLRRDLSVVVVDALRPGHETSHYPGETNLRGADVAIVTKVSSASAGALEHVRRSVAALAPRAALLEADLELRVERPERIRGRRVLAVEDGPTLTHGGMAFGAATVAARLHGARELVDPRPFAVGSVAEAFARHPHIGPALPALGYSEAQRQELAETIARSGAEVVVDGSPVTMNPRDAAAAAIALLERHAARNYAPLPVVITRGDGPFLWDIDGRRYLDGLSAYSAVNQGHVHPRIVAALVEQAGRLTITSRAFHNDRLGPFLEKLCGLTGFSLALPMNTGAEAVETAVKAMRRHAHERRGIPADGGELVVAEENFHGRTLLAVSLSTDPTSYGGYGPLAPRIVKVPFGDLAAMERAVGPRTVGVLLEPVQGEAGVILPPDGYLAAVRALCAGRGVPRCRDEVQTGCARTGRPFAWEHWGARPDLLCVGKALSGGLYPVSAVCGTEEVLGVFTPGTHGSTYGGNPLAAAVALAAIDVVVGEGLPERAARLGDLVLSRLRSALAGVPVVKEVRGRGLMTEVQYRSDVARRVAESLARDASVLCKDTRGHTVRFLPPLVTPEDVMLEAIERMIPVLAAG